ncbi:HAD family hydrolase [Streptomyces sp. NPDC048737]|uniref:HAD family hydrolase n=1 Tax=unclassified Streptomyces TaxID=2593676 RepID=UPI0034175F8A
MRLALLDLDGTPVDRTSALADAVADLCHDHAYGPGIERWPLTQLADHAERSDFARLRAAFGPGESADHLWRVYVDRMAAAVTCRPAVLNGPARPRERGWSVGVATNGSSDIQRAEVGATGLADLVDGIGAWGDIAVRKPDPRLFELAAARCGTRIGAGDRMTGDAPENDVRGGHRAGLRTIRVTGRPWPEGLTAPTTAPSTYPGPSTTCSPTPRRGRVRRPRPAAHGGCSPRRHPPFTPAPPRRSPAPPRSSRSVPPPIEGRSTWPDRFRGLSPCPSSPRHSL